MKKGRPPKKMKRPRQSAARQNAGPLALFGFVVNVTASFFRQFSRHISTWEKELNRRRQTLKPLENQGFFRLSLLYRNGTYTQACSSMRALMWLQYRGICDTSRLQRQRTSTVLCSKKHRQGRAGQSPTHLSLTKKKSRAAKKPNSLLKDHKFKIRTSAVNEIKDFEQQREPCCFAIKTK